MAWTKAVTMPAMEFYVHNITEKTKDKVPHL
jgi:hypothetical protein